MPTSLSRGVQMRILMLHNHYRLPGGEDTVFDSEAQLLEAHGHEVIRYTRHNDEVEGMRTLTLARDLLWSRRTYQDLSAIIREKRPDIVHAHNIFPLISPSAYSSARDAGIPVVQTLHNFRLVCANGHLFRNGRFCKDCVGSPGMWPALVHKCYRGSIAATAGVVGMVQYHRIVGTWRDLVDVYIAMSDLARDTLIHGGLPRGRIVVKPNFVDDWEEAPYAESRDCFLYVGRLTEEKGVNSLLEAWDDYPGLPPIVIVGDGPLRGEVEKAVGRGAQVSWRGTLSRKEVRSLLHRSAVLIFPSLTYEGCPMVIIEALAAGVPVICSAGGAAAVMIKAGHTGLHFRPGDGMALREQVLWACRNPMAIRSMGRNARTAYEEQFTPELNYRLLLNAYGVAAKSSDKEFAPLA